MLIKLGAGMMTLFFLLGAAVFQGGFFILDVQDKSADKHLFIPVPMSFVNFGLSLIPKHSLNTIDHDVAAYSPVILAVFEELARYPDVTFVEVEAPDKNLRIAKDGRNIILDFQSSEERVYMQFPIKSTGKLLQKIAMLQETYE